MGRGRAKAKQQRVARRLKYSAAGGTDLDRLRAELGVADEDRPSRYEPDGNYADPYDELVDRYADFADGNPRGTAEDESDRH
ncbi:DUF3073 family protein [Lipingzhangella sp. LS1_29]|uniref:DUF3073 family protein n=1 Tax=Lipingzhangella rawalii TaxID=2055835 RepID=A0ABU2H998_9ACTN|nr:DUF3073 family protein [Lipingzhangella rawalii]MDS1271886.1 DUF3073 family protein [Lipingzhangella rawalii]